MMKVRFSHLLFYVCFILSLLLGVAASCDGGTEPGESAESPVGGGSYHESAVREGVCLDTSDGLLWATMNVGAARPEDVGSYIAWAETKPKEEYSIDTYIYAAQGENSLTKYCMLPKYGNDGFTDAEELTELLPADDAATARWGSQWRTPSRDEWERLVRECDWQWAVQRGIHGYRVSSRLHPEKSIFLPAAGRKAFLRTEDADKFGYYWTRTLDEYYPMTAFAQRFSSDNADAACIAYLRFLGYSIRPVMSAPAE